MTPRYRIMVTASYGNNPPHTPIPSYKTLFGPVPFAEATRLFQESNEEACYRSRLTGVGPLIYSVVQA